jgi:hypothetical protein
MSQYGPGDKPPTTRKVKVRAHTRKVKTGSRDDGAPSSTTRPLNNPIANDLAARGQGEPPPSRRPAAPSPAVKEQHAALGRERPRAARAQQQLESNRVPKGTQAPQPQVRQHHADIGQSRPDRRAGRHADLAAALDAIREATKTAGRGAVARGGEKKHGGGLFGTVLGKANEALAGKLTEGAVHAAETAASKAAPIAVKIARGPIAATAEAGLKAAGGPDIGKFLSREAKAAGKDIVDLPANAIPSLYVPAREAAKGHPGKAAKMLAQPFIDVAKHPGKALLEHPVATPLLAAGAKGAVGHGIGKTLRTLPSETTKRLGSVERGTAEVANANIHAREDRTYSKDAITKAFQVLADKRRGGTKSPHMTADEIKRRMDEQQAASEDVRRINRGEVVHEGRTILGQRGPVGKLRGHRAHADVTLAAQHIADTPAELRAYLTHLEGTAKGLEGDKLRRNKQAQRDIRKALKHPRPKTGEQAAKYRELNVKLQQELADLEIIDPKQMEQARLMAYATSPVKGMGARMLTPEETEARVESATAARDAAKKELDHAKATFQATVHAEGEAHGRAQILSRNVGGRRAEVAASKRREPVLEGGGHGLEQARGRVTAASARVFEASQAVKAADRVLADARKTHREGGHLVDEHGNQIAPEDIRAHMEANGVTSEPAFITHAPNQRGARNFYVRADKAPAYHGPKRTGAAVREGTADLDPEVMVEQLARTQGLVDAAHRFRAMIDEFAHRKADDTLDEYDNWQDAHDAAIRMVDDKDGEPIPHAVEMVPVRVNPFGGRRAQLEKTLEAVNQQAAHDHITEQIDHALSGADKGSPGVWALIPKVAAERERQHLSVGQSGMGKFGQLYGGQFRKVVLSLSPKWLTGNVVEAALRTMIAHAGPRSVFTGYKALKGYEEKYGKDASAELKSRVAGGGHYSLAHRTDIRVGGQDFADSGRKVAAIAEAMGKIRRTPGPKQVADLWGLYTHVVMKSVNGRLEHAFQTAQFGKALREHPLMSDRTFKLSHDAIADAVEGLRDTNVQVRLGREVDRMYGRYAKFSPGKRRMIAGYTPFIAWYLNAVEFLTSVLPRDHPVLTSVLASANQATEEWRKQHGLITSFMQNLTGAGPDFLQGSIPGKEGTNLRVSRYTPFGIFGQEGGVAGGFAGALLPQFTGMVHNALGEDWKGDKLSKNGSTQGHNALAAAITLIENSVPLVSQGATLTGAHLPNEAEGAQHPDSLGARARKAYDPFMYAASNKPGGGPTPDWAKGLDTNLPPLPKLPPLPAIH